MLANFFGKSKPVNFLVIFTLFLVYFFLHFFYTEISFNSIKELFYFVVIFAVFNFILAKNQLTFDNSYAFLVFVILIGFFPTVIKINYTLYATITILLFLRKVYSLQSSKNTLHKLFDGGLWLGISFLIEPYTAVFAILLYASTYLHQRFTYQTLLTPLISFGSVIFLFFTYCFWYEKTADFYLLFNWSYLYNIDLYLSTKYLFPNIIIGIFVILAFMLKSPKALAVLNTFRKNWILTFIHLITSTIVVLLINPKNGSELLFLFFPTAVILANGLELFQKKWLADVLLLLLLVTSVLTNFL